MTFKERLAELGFSSYESYLRSPHWREVRRRFFASKLWKGACFLCRGGKAPFHVHHKTYKRIGAEYLTDLVALCERCHARVHEFERTHPRSNLWEASRRVHHRRAIRQAGARS